MIKKIIHVSLGPLTGYYAESLFIPQCLNSGVQIEFLSIPSCFGFPSGYHAPEYKHLAQDIHSLEVLKAILTSQQNPEVLINIQVHFEWRFVEVFKILSTISKSPISCFLTGEIPLAPVVSKSRIKKLINPFFMSKWLFQKALLQVYKRKNIIKFPSTYFCAGQSRPYQTGTYSIFPINYVDYDRTIRLKDDTLTDLPTKFAVYLDLGITNHPDMHFYKMSYSQEDFKKHRDRMNAFFSLVEKQTGCPVIIAVHPKVQYSAEHFEQRRQEKNKTAELVKKSELVITHYSTSTSYAVIYDKPIVFVYDDVLGSKDASGLPVISFIKNFAERLQATCIDISNSDTIQLTLAHSQEAYSSFKRNYLIGDGLDGKDSATAFLDYLNTL
ncbi:MAG TPA: hypothetical protein VF412_11730 [Bdellovibrio sp.]|uniref:hypothetical protein n=1 Tax=Bdellovibrio sp. TaxID=28201 RepID=UPI002EEE84DA